MKARPFISPTSPVPGRFARACSSLLLLSSFALADWKPVEGGMFTRWGREVVADKAPVEAQWIGWACAAFAFPLVIVGLTWLEPLTKAASAGFGNG